jgi:hypothetical protein
MNPKLWALEDSPPILDEVRRGVGDHEVFLSFNADSDAELFNEWLFMHGWSIFKEWRDANGSSDTRA